MAVDLIAPSLPAIAIMLHASASIAKNAVTTYLLGYAIGNFISGFLSDAYGRKFLLRLSILGFLISSLLPVFLPNETVLLFSRLLQGIFLGSQSVVARAILSDILPPTELKSMGTMLGTMWALGPIAGPVIGGYLQHYFGWQAGFVFFAVISFMLLLVVIKIIPETHLSPTPLRITTMHNNMTEVLSHKAFMGLVVLMGLAYSMIIVFNTQGPFLIHWTLDKRLP